MLVTDWDVVFLKAFLVKVEFVAEAPRKGGTQEIKRKPRSSSLGCLALADAGVRADIRKQGLDGLGWVRGEGKRGGYAGMAAWLGDAAAKRLHSRQTPTTVALWQQRAPAHPPLRPVSFRFPRLTAVR